MRKKLSIQEASKIADAYCVQNCESRKALYRGMFDGGKLFRLNYQGEGHHGLPIFIVVFPDGEIKELEAHSDDFYQAWRVSDDYLSESIRI